MKAPSSMPTTPYPLRRRSLLRRALRAPAAFAALYRNMRRSGFSVTGALSVAARSTKLLLAG